MSFSANRNPLLRDFFHWNLLIISFIGGVQWNKDLGPPAVMSHLIEGGGGGGGGGGGVVGSQAGGVVGSQASGVVGSQAASMPSLWVARCIAKLAVTLS